MESPNNNSKENQMRESILEKRTSSQLNQEESRQNKKRVADGEKDQFSKLAKEAEGSWVRTGNCWQNQLRYLSGKRQIAYEVSRNIKQNAQIILYKLGNPSLKKKRSAVILGEVQSGKTTSMQALLSLALDNGFKMIIILSGRTVALHQQTLGRMEECLEEDELDMPDFHDPNIIWLTSDGEDISGKGIESKVRSLDLNGGPIIAVIKKTSTSLCWIQALLDVVNPSAKLNRRQESLRGALKDYLNQPCLIIDDECDDASLNYNPIDREPSKIFAFISTIQNGFKNCCHYVGYTATPLPNLLFEPDQNLFPDFLWSIENTSEGYLGLDMFRDEELKDNLIKIVPYEDYPGLEKSPGNRVMPTGARRGLKALQERVLAQRKPFLSMYEALFDFAITGAIRKWRFYQQKKAMKSSTDQSCDEEVDDIEVCSTITNMNNLPLEDFKGGIQKQEKNMYHLVLSLNYERDVLNEKIIDAIENMIDNETKKIQNFHIKMKELRRLPELLRRDAFVQEKFVITPVSDNDAWIVALANAINKNIFVYSLDRDDTTHFQMDIVDRYYSNAQGTVHVFYKNPESYQLIKNEGIVRLLPANPLNPNPLSPTFVETNEEGLIRHELSSSNKCWHAGLFHFSQFKDMNMQVFELVKCGWEKVKETIIKHLNSSDEISKHLKQTMEKSWSRLYKNMNMWKDQYKYYIPEWSDLNPFLRAVCDKTVVKLFISGNSSPDIIKTFDYEDINFPEYILCVGGNILGRGITINGLTTCYYVRSSSRDCWDVSLQHCRWFGWRPGYLDLMTLYLHERQLQLFEDISKADEKLREKFKELAHKNLSPKEYKVFIEKYHSFETTQPRKRRNQAEVSVAAVQVCNEPTLEKDKAFNSLDLTAAFFCELKKTHPSEEIVERYKTICFHNVDYDCIMNFLESICHFNQPLNVLITRLDVLRGEEDFQINVGIVKGSESDIDYPYQDHPFVSDIKAVCRGRETNENEEPTHKIKLKPSRHKTDTLFWDEFADAPWTEKQEIDPRYHKWYQMDDDLQKPLFRKESAPVLLLFYLIHPYFIGRKKGYFSENSPLAGPCPLVCTLGFFGRRGNDVRIVYNEKVGSLNNNSTNGSSQIP